LENGFFISTAALKLDSSSQINIIFNKPVSKNHNIPLTQSPEIFFYIPYYWDIEIQSQYAADLLWEFKIAQTNVS